MLRKGRDPAGSRLICLTEACLGAGPAPPSPPGSLLAYSGHLNSRRSHIKHTHGPTRLWWLHADVPEDTAPALKDHQPEWKAAQHLHRHPCLSIQTQLHSGPRTSVTMQHGGSLEHSRPSARGQLGPLRSAGGGSMALSIHLHWRGTRARERGQSELQCGVNAHQFDRY